MALDQLITRRTSPLSRREHGAIGTVLDKPQPWLFAVLTPYHLLLSLLVSSTAPEGVRSDIVAPITFPSFGKYVSEVAERLQRTCLRPDIRIEALSCPYPYRRRLVVSDVKVVRRFARAPYGRVFVCNDSWSQSLALALRAQHQRVPVSMIEDGLDTYTRVTPHISKTSRAAIALTGLWVDRSFLSSDRTERFHRLFTEIWCLAPDLLPPELAPARALPEDPKATAIAAKVLIGPDQLDLLPHDQTPGIIVAPLTSNPLAPRCAELIEQLTRVPNRDLIAVKYHPREPATDPFGVADRPGFVILEPSVPLETYLLCRQVAFVVGPPSTSLLFTRRVLPAIPVASLDLTSELGQVLARAGVESAEELLHPLLSRRDHVTVAADITHL